MKLGTGLLILGSYFYIAERLNCTTLAIVAFAFACLLNMIHILVDRKAIKKPGEFYFSVPAASLAPTSWIACSPPTTKSQP